MDTQSSRLRGAWAALLTALTLPPAILHEATHAVLAAPWADQLAVVIEPRTSRAMVGIDWRPNVPGWAVWLAHYGPLVVGSMVGLAGGGLLLAGYHPDSARAWLFSGLLAVWWMIYVTPSADDREIPAER